MMDHIFPSAILPTAAALFSLLSWGGEREEVLQSVSLKYKFVLRAQNSQPELRLQHAWVFVQNTEKCLHLHVRCIVS